MVVTIADQRIRDVDIYRQIEIQRESERDINREIDFITQETLSDQISFTRV